VPHLPFAFMQRTRTARRDRQQKLPQVLARTADNPGDIRDTDEVRTHLDQFGSGQRSFDIRDRAEYGAVSGEKLIGCLHVDVEGRATLCREMPGVVGNENVRSSVHAGSKNVTILLVVRHHRLQWLVAVIIASGNAIDISVFTWSSCSTLRSGRSAKMFRTISSRMRCVHKGLYRPASATDRKRSRSLADTERPRPEEQRAAPGPVPPLWTLAT
jgi:hypothetical protein